MKQNLRFAALEKFRSLKSKILVTTDLANRGLDLPQVDLIINYNCPKSATIYVHRVGRTCRKPDFKTDSNDNPMIRSDIELDNEDIDGNQIEKNTKKFKRDSNSKNSLKPKRSQTVLSSKYLGKSITFITQYDIDLFKSIENFIGIKMNKQDIDEKSVISIMKQVSVAIKDAEIRLEHEEQESKHIENMKRGKAFKNGSNPRANKS